MNEGDHLVAHPPTRRGSSVQHVAILSALLVPIAFIPYLFSRRQLSTLRRQVNELEASTAALKRCSEKSMAASTSPRELAALRRQVERSDTDSAKSLSGVTLDLIHIKDELETLRSHVSALGELKDALGKLQDDAASASYVVSNELRELRAQQDGLQAQIFKVADELTTMKNESQAVDTVELHRLLREARQTRSLFMAMGSSFGDFATLIQRIEIELGHERSAGSYDPVERLRKLALRMQEASRE